MTEQTSSPTSIKAKIEAKIEAAKNNVAAQKAASSTNKQNPSDGLPPTGFIRLPDVLKLIPVGRASWWEGIKEGRYPRGVKIGKRSTAWRVEDIRNLIDRLGAE